MRYWKRINALGDITTVESYSHDLNIGGAIEIDKMEFDDYITSLPTPIFTPPRDLGKELDELKIKVATLESR